MRILALPSRRRSTLFAAGIAIVMAVWLGVPAYNHNVARMNLNGVVEFIESGYPALQKACTDGAFDSIQGLSELRLKSSKRSALVQATILQHRGLGELEVTFALEDFGSAWSAINRYQRALILDYSCTAARQFSSRLSAKSTIDARYVPTRLRI